MKRPVALAAACLALGACGAQELGAPRGTRREVAPVRGGVLRLATFSDVRSVDPAVAFDEVSHPVVRLMFDTLVGYGPDGRIHPLLAESFTRSEDGLAWTFRIREHVVMHDGEELTADDVKRSIERTLRHDTPCPSPSFYARIRGYGAFHDGVPGAGGEVAYAEHLDGVSVLGRYVVRFDLSEPDATFLPVLSLFFAAPVCRSAGATWTREFASQPCGAGPFRLASWDAGRELRLVRHAGYHEPGLPYLDEVRYAVLVPILTQRFEFEIGDIDFLREMRFPDAVRYRDDARWAPFGQWSTARGTQGVFLNSSVPPFDSVEVRRAVAAAADWSEIAKLRSGFVERAQQLIPPIVAGHDPSFPGQRHDVDAALAHMRAAGFAFDPATGAGGYPKLLRYVGTSEGFDGYAAQVLQQQLARIGIRFDIQLTSWPSYLARVGRRGEVAMGYAGWSLDFPDPSDFFEPTLASDAIQDEDSQNVAFFSHAELDDVLRRARRSLDERERLSLYRRAEEIVRDEAPWSIGYDFRYWEVAQPYLHDYRADLVDTLDVRRVWIDGAGRTAAAELERARRTWLALLPARRGPGRGGAAHAR